MIKRLALMLAVVACASCAEAGRSVGLGADAFTRLTSANDKNVAFSPVSFELDAVMFANAADTITRANMVETMGVLNELASVYVPIYRDLNDNTITDGCSYVSARAFCVPAPRSVAPAFRQRLQEEYSANVLPIFPKEGTECWFKAMMDGDMEDFEIPGSVAVRNRFAYYDLVSLSLAWAEPFPTENTKERVFETIDGKKIKLPMICDSRIASTWENSRMSVLKLPMAEGYHFYALKPRGKATIEDVKKELTAERISIVLSIMNSVTEDGVNNGPVAIVMPKFDLKSSLEISSAMQSFHFPTGNLKELGENLAGSEIVQITRFRFDENGVGEALEKKDPKDEVKVDQKTRKMIFNRPFVYFVYSEKHDALIVAGQYTGK